MRNENSFSRHNGLIRRCVLVLSMILAQGALVPRAPAVEAVRLQVIIVRASHSGSDFDKRLNFARKNLLAYGYKGYAYAWSHTFVLATDRAERFSVGPGISALITLKGLLEESNRVQYSLLVYNREKKQAGAIYTIPRNGMGIAVVPQPAGRAYIIIVRPLR